MKKNTFSYLFVFIHLIFSLNCNSLKGQSIQKKFNQLLNEACQDDLYDFLKKANCFDEIDFFNQQSLIILEDTYNLEFIEEITHERFILVKYSINENIFSFRLNYLTDEDDFEFDINHKDLAKIFKNEIKLKKALVNILARNQRYDYAADWLPIYRSNSSDEVKKLVSKIKRRRAIYHDLTDIELIIIYKEEAEKGDLFAMIQLGELYEKNDSLIHTNGINQCIFWYQKAANLGSIYSTGQLAEIYEKGKFSEPDYKKAFYWYQKYNELDSSKGLFELAYYYKIGRGVEKDLVESKKYYDQLFALGKINKRLAKSLAYNYEKGEEGLEKNIKKAIYWLEIAHELGDPFASKRIERLIKTQPQRL